MMRQTRLLTMIFAVVFASIGFQWSPTPANAIDLPGCHGTPDQCFHEWLNRSQEGLLCLNDFTPDVCWDTWDAMQWAVPTALALFPDGQDGNMGNAFQHCAWIGAIATRHTEEVAIGIGDNHEEAVPTESHLREMDLRNNEIGAEIGNRAQTVGFEDMWGYVMGTCEDMARNGQLYGPCGLGQYTPDGASRPTTITECEDLNNTNIG